jgi:uncharacterized membrane protein
MFDQTESSQVDEGGRNDWFGGIVALLVFSALITSLYFVVPKLQVSWANRGMIPPFYGRLLISMTRNMWLVVLVGFVLVGLSFRRRA